MGWCAQGLRSATRPAGTRRGEGGGRGRRRRRVLGEGRHDRPGARAGGLPPRRRGSVCGWEGWSERSGVRSRAQRGADLADARERCRSRRAPPRRSLRAPSMYRRCSKTPPRQQQQQQPRAPPPPRKARWAQARVLRPTRPSHSSPPAKAWPSQAGVTPQRWATSCAFWRSIGKRASGAGSTWRRRSPLAA